MLYDYVLRLVYKMLWKLPMGEYLSDDELDVDER